MAELLGVTASIIAVLQISESVISACYQYYRAAKGAKKEIVMVINTVSDLKSTLSNLHALLDYASPEESQLAFLTSISPALDRCEDLVKKVASRLGVDVTNMGPQNIAINFRQKLTWPWEAKDVTKVLDTIEKQKTILTIALVGDGLRVSLAIDEKITGMVHDNNSDKIFKWLATSDPSINHQLARKKHEPTTGLWLTGLDLFRNWADSEKSTLWLHGIPGAGKTVIFSTVVEHIMKMCHGERACHYAYFYFDFNDTQKQTVNGLLRSMIIQLCVGLDNLPSAVSDLYRQFQNGQKQPESSELLEVLLAILRMTDVTFLLIDALDECAEVDDLCEAIKHIVQGSMRLRLFLASRTEKRITEGLQELVDFSIDLNGAGVDADIRLHIHKSLETDRRLRKWPQLIKEEIETALVDRADSM